MSGTMRRSLAGFVVAVTIAASPAAWAESLTDALISAYKHSGLLEQNRALLRAADEDVAQAVSALRPVLNYYANATYANPVSQLSGRHTSANVGLQADLLLFDGGQSKLAIDLAKESVLATRQGLISVEQSVLLRAVTAYMSVRRDTETLAISRNNVRVITQELRAAQDRFEVGEVTRTDVALAESRLAAARANEAAAQGALAQSREEYRVAVGRYPGPLSAPPRLPATAKSLEGARAVAYRTHPLLLQAQHDVAAADLGVARAKTLVRPNLTLTGRANQADSGITSSSIGLEFGGPIYQGGNLSSLHRQAIAQRDAARAGLHVTRHDIAQLVGNAWAQVLVARARLVATDRQIRAAQVAFRGIREEATLGARTTLDVLDAEQELLDARSARVAAVTDEYIATYSLLSSMGLLTVDHLRLGIQTYDPAAYYNAVKGAPTPSLQGKKLDGVLKALGKD